MSREFLFSLELMWKGMFGIFAVLALIAFIVFIISKMDKPKTEK